MDLPVTGHWDESRLEDSDISKVGSKSRLPDRIVKIIKIIDSSPNGLLFITSREFYESLSKKPIYFVIPKRDDMKEPQAFVGHVQSRLQRQQ